MPPKDKEISYVHRGKNEEVLGRVRDKYRFLETIQKRRINMIGIKRGRTTHGTETPACGEKAT